MFLSRHHISFEGNINAMEKSNLMNVGLLTSHSSMNYGGLLQAYALREKIRDFGYNCNIINYKPKVHDINKHPIKFVIQRKNFIKKGLFGIVHHDEIRQKMELLANFRRIYFDVEDDNVIDFKNLGDASKAYDILCVGSDQLWNLNQKDNENKAYMLNFDHSCPSFSYGVSFGDGLQEKKQDIENALPLIKQFECVSVREKEGQDFLHKHSVNANLVLDPTLLVEASFWKQFRGKKRIVNDSYVLIYGYENAYQKYGDLIHAAEKAQSLLRLKVVNPILTPDLCNAGFTNISKCGPIEFINLVENAELVVTNSFHGSIFSSICGVPFISIKTRGVGDESRKKNLLKMLDMEHRSVFWDEKWNLEDIISDYTIENNIQLRNMREASERYIKKSLQECTQHAKQWKY